MENSAFYFLMFTEHLTRNFLDVYVMLILILESTKYCYTFISLSKEQSLTSLEQSLRSFLLKIKTCPGILQSPSTCRTFEVGITALSMAIYISSK